MLDNSLNTKVVNAAKWSGITEVVAKLVAPITTVVLARLLTPDAFGILVTAQMVISFAELFTDAGFQKFIVQYEFENEIEKHKSTAVAFWSNLIMSLVIWLIIGAFSSQIAKLVGCDGKGLVISISCICIPLSAFSSIQMALFRRSLEFKTLFWIRIIGILIPIVVTIPIAFYTRSYWALIIGMIAQNVFNAFILTLKSTWKPKWFFSIGHFKGMFSFTVWSMLEAISIWLTSYIDIFIVGTLLSQYYLGLYRTSMNTVGQITALITAATTPVLFSSLSRLQNSREEFSTMFFKFQRLVGILVIPLGVGIFIFSNLITKILLGDQWIEASRFIGEWGLTSSFVIVLAHYSSEVYRSLGKPKLSVLAQWLHIAALLPVILIFIHDGFSALCTARSLIRLEMIIVQLTIMGVIVKMNIWKMLTNILPSTLAACAMFLVFLLPQATTISLQFIYVILCAVIYIAVIITFPKERNILFNLPRLLKR